MEIRHKAYKFRIYPTKEQRIFFAKTFGCVRFVYNHFLTVRVDAYANNEFVSYNDTAKALVPLKEEYKFLKEVDSICLQQALRHLDSSFKNHYRNKSFGFPKYKSKKEHRYSYTTMRVGENIHLQDGFLVLPKVKAVKIKQHRTIPEDYTLKSVTVSQTPSGKYYASILYEYEAEIKQIENPDHVVGLDFSIPELYVSANNIDANVTHFYMESLKKLQREQRKLSLCVPGSKNYEKQRIKVAKIHEKIANQRKDYLHKKSTQIANAYDCICIEDVSIPEIVEGLPYHPVHRTIYDDAWGMFSYMVEYKMADRGKYLLKADKTFRSSQICHCCGYIYSDLTLAERKWTCPNCHAFHDRDKNAAINLKVEGERLLKELLLTS